MSGIVSIHGGHGSHSSVTVYGNGTVIGGNGDDTINITGKGHITIGDGKDVLTLGNGGVISQTGGSGHDTINLGAGNDTLFVQGTAVVTGPFGDCSNLFGSATIKGGELVVGKADGRTADVTAISGNITIAGGLVPLEMSGGSGSTVLKGGFGPDTFVGGSSWTASTDMKGGLGDDTFIGGLGAESMTGGNGRNLFEFLPSTGGHTFITNFVAGQDHLFLDGNSLQCLECAGDVKVKGHDTIITLGGGTVVTLENFTNLKPSDITTHK